MKWVVLALAIISAATGFLAAYWWYKASKVDYRPFDENGRELPDGDTHAWTGAIRRTLSKSGALNKTAAIWTAISVFSAALSALASALNST